MRTLNNATQIILDKDEWKDQPSLDCDPLFTLRAVTLLCFIAYHSLSVFKPRYYIVQAVCESLPSIAQNVPSMIHRRQLRVLSLCIDLLPFQAFRLSNHFAVPFFTTPLGFDLWYFSTSFSTSFSTLALSSGL